MARGLPARYIRKYGISKRAWREYRKDRGGSSRSSGGKRKMSRGGSKILGNFGLKGILLSGGILALLKYLMRTKFPQAGAYTTSISAMGAGGVAKGLDTTGKSMLSYGAIDGVSELITDLVMPGGVMTIPSLGGATNKGGYDLA